MNSFYYYILSGLTIILCFLIVLIAIPTVLLTEALSFIWNTWHKDEE